MEASFLFLLLRGHDRILRSFRHPHRNRSLSGNFDGFTCGWISSHTSLPLHQNQIPNPREGKGAGLLGLRNRQRRDFVYNSGGCL